MENQAEMPKMEWSVKIEPNWSEDNPQNPEQTESHPVKEEGIWIKPEPTQQPETFTNCKQEEGLGNADLQDDSNSEESTEASILKLLLKGKKKETAQFQSDKHIPSKGNKPTVTNSTSKITGAVYQTCYDRPCDVGLEKVCCLREIVEQESSDDSDDFSVVDSDASDDDEEDDNDSIYYHYLNNIQNTNPNYIGVDDFIWAKKEPPRSNNSLACNAIPRPDKPTEFPGFLQLWSKLLDDEMVTNIVTHTNTELTNYRRDYQADKRLELRDTDKSEIISLFGLLCYSVVFKCNHTDVNYLFATDGTAHEIFRCVMSKNRFCTLLTHLKFDDANSRKERLESNPLAPISEIFEAFFINCQKNFTLGPYTCIDDMLIPFTGTCKFLVSMPKKPSKIGIKLVVLCDVKSSYAFNAFIYPGNTGLSEAEEASANTQCVLKLAKPIFNTNRNITAGKAYSSIQLMQHLRKANLTYIGALKKTRKEIPPEFQPDKSRELGSMLYGYTEDFTIMSYVPKINKATILISSNQHGESTVKMSGEPSIIADYNRTKGAVDDLDKNCSMYSCARKSQLWAMVIFYKLVDFAVFNSFELYKACQGSKLKKRDYLLSLARELVLPHLQTRVYSNRLPRELRLSIRGVLGKDVPPPPPKPDVAAVKRGIKHCVKCISNFKRQRQTRYLCCACDHPVCIQCSSKICVDCQNTL